MDPKALQLFDRHFEVYGDRFDYSNVQSLRWLTVKTTKFVYFLPIGVDYTCELLIHFLAGAPLQLGTGAFSVDLSKGGFQEFEATARALHAATYETRLAQYQEQLQRSGCFEYDEMMFFVDGSVERKGRRRFIDFATPARAEAAHTQLRCLPSGSIEVSTLWDRDCFHALLTQMHKARAEN